MTGLAVLERAYEYVVVLAVVEGARRGRYFEAYAQALHLLRGRLVLLRRG